MFLLGRFLWTSCYNLSFHCPTVLSFNFFGRFYFLNQLLLSDLAQPDWRSVWHWSLVSMIFSTNFDYRLHKNFCGKSLKACFFIENDKVLCIKIVLMMFVRVILVFLMRTLRSGLRVYISHFFWCSMFNPSLRIVNDLLIDLHVSLKKQPTNTKVSKIYY